MVYNTISIIATECMCVRLCVFVSQAGCWMPTVVHRLKSSEMSLRRWRQIPADSLSLRYTEASLTYLYFYPPLMQLKMPLVTPVVCVCVSVCLSCSYCNLLKPWTRRFMFRTSECLWSWLYTKLSGSSQGHRSRHSHTGITKYASWGWSDFD